MLGARGPSNVTFTYVVDRFEKPRPGPGGWWISPIFLTLLVVGDSNNRDVSAALKLALTRYTNHRGQNLSGCE